MNSTPIAKSYDFLNKQLQSRSKSLVLLETLMYLLVIVIGTLGNSAVLWIVYKKRNSGKISYFLIGSLALSDIFLPMFSGWQSIEVLKLGYWPFSNFVCQLQGFFVISLACASLLIMTLTAVNRYFRVVRPTYYRSIFTSKRTTVFIGLAWILACMEPLPYLISGERYVFHPGKYFCFQESKVKFTVLLLYGFIGLPMALLSVCYYKLFKTIREHQRRIQNMKRSSKSISGPNIEDIRATRTLFLTVVAFMCCWIPIAIIDFIDLVRGSSTLPRQVYVLYTFLGNTSAAINPFIYGVMNKMFREEYKKILRLRWIGRSESDTVVGVARIRRAVPSETGRP